MFTTPEVQQIAAPHYEDSFSEPSRLDGLTPGAYDEDVRRALTLGLLVLANCADPEPKCVLLYDVTYVTVTDADGLPVDGLEFHTVRTDTGEDITPELDQIFVVQRDGQYPIVDDSTARLLGDDEVPIVFTVSGEQGSGDVEGLVRASNDGCSSAVYHGPDRLTLSTS